MNSVNNKYHLLVLMVLLPFVCFSQNMGCKDSVSFTNYYNQYFTGMDISPSQRDNEDNLYLSAKTKIGVNGYDAILKFNSQNQLVWYKNYLYNQFFTDIVPYALNSIDNNANLVFVNFGFNQLTNKYQSFVSKTDSAGNFIWGRRIERSDAPTINGGLYNDNDGTVAEDGSSFYFFGTTDDLQRVNIVKIDSGGNVRWSKKFGNNILPQFRIIKSKIAYQENNVAVLFVHFYYNAVSSTDINAKHGIQLIKINCIDGRILNQKTIMYYYDINGRQPNLVNLQKIKYDKSRKHFLLDSRGQFFSPINKSHVISLFDENLNLIKTNYFEATSFLNGTEDVRISNDNLLTITNRISSSIGPTTITYATFNNDIELSAQRKIVLNNIGFPNVQFISNVTFKKNGILNFQMGFNAANFNPGSPSIPIFLFDHSPFYQGINNCLGFDTIVYKKNNIYTFQINDITFNEFNGVPLQSTNVFYTDPILDLQMSESELCKEVSICDTIKLLGNNYHCISNPMDSFKIIRNPLCKRITNWQVDTSYIKVINKNDTILYVQYLKPFKGSIKVGFGGCSIMDEIPIEVYAPQKAINLGNDTMYCPNKTITLYTGGGFKNYVWQDGSTQDSLITSEPGLYHVTAIDNCGNKFTDSILIKPFDVELNFKQSKQICVNDTALFYLPDKLYNYNWTPISTSRLQNLTWQLYPTTTTIYRISGERFPGCIINDTVLINVKTNCKPDYIFFPNAFTPNEDGINDTYKPGINGQLIFYELVLYNRYGQTVFKTSDSTKGWNGHFKNNKNPLPGSYIWICKYQFAGKTRQLEKGSFILLR